MKKAIVTGANGFIGSALCHELAKQNVQIIAVDRKNANWAPLADLDVVKTECDLCDIAKLPSLVPQRDIDCAFHLAWQGVMNKDSENYEIQLFNIHATLQLIDAIGEMQIRKFIIPGSVDEFEIRTEMEENQPIRNLRGMYKIAKMSAHWMGKVEAGSRNISFFCPMTFSTYGEGDTAPRVINTFLRSLMNEKCPELSDGTQMYDFVHVSDVARALYLVAEKGTDGREYIIGSGNPKPLREFLTQAADIVYKITGQKPVTLGFGKFKGKAIHLPAQAFDVSSLVQDTGFQPEISFEEGIRRTTNWILSNR